MEAVLKFQFPEEKDEFTVAVNGQKYWSALYQLQSDVHSKVKWAENQNTTWEEVETLIYDILDDYGIRLDDVS